MTDFNFAKYNKILGWTVFAIALIVVVVAAVALLPAEFLVLIFEILDLARQPFVGLRGFRLLPLRLSATVAPEGRAPMFIMLFI